MILTTENNSDRNLRCCAVRILKKLLPGKQMGKETKVNQISQTLQELKRGESELKPIAKLACWLTLLLGFHAIDAEVHAGFPNLETGSITFWNSAYRNASNQIISLFC